MQRLYISPVNSIVFVSDTIGIDVPNIIPGRKIWTTATCIAVATYPEQDGETLLTFGPIGEVDPGRSPDLDTVIDTPTRTLIIQTAETEILTRASVPVKKTNVKVWLSHPLWPEEVVIGFE